MIKFFTFDIFVYSLLIILGVLLIIFSIDIINIVQLGLLLLIGFFGIILIIIGTMCIIENIKENK